MPTIDLVITLLALATAVGLGLSAGALVTEGAVLVPMWRKQGGAAFLHWYRKHAPLLLHFFGPLEAIALILALAHVGFSTYVGVPPSPAAWAAAGGALCVLLFFPLFFRRANARFERAEITDGEVAAAIDTWARWHWARTAVAVLAFVHALLAIG